MIIIKKPVITEKSIKAYEDQNKVTFEVSLDADKTKAAKVLEEVYGVKVIDSKVVNRLGKKRVNRLNRRIDRKSSDKKIMIFTLKDGNKIDLFKA